MKKRTYPILNLVLTCKWSFHAIYKYDICHDCRRAFARFNLSEGTANELYENYRQNYNYHGPLTPRFCFSTGELVFRPEDFAQQADKRDEIGLGYPPFWVIVPREERLVSTQSALWSAYLTDFQNQVKTSGEAEASQLETGEAKAGDPRTNGFLMSGAPGGLERREYFGRDELNWPLPRCQPTEFGQDKSLPHLPGPPLPELDTNKPLPGPPRHDTPRLGGRFENENANPELVLGSKFYIPRMT
jgi:hypothetical protein